ncbi:uncharacterized protein C8orf74 homolog isoform X2 [Lineus longissimus]|uniref:uncharacterized protein C8orf74 homolog isoform X2 n=1 Tax=Lineus longissimus TaxID=88925 RepID=UPI002B4CA2C6
MAVLGLEEAKAISKLDRNSGSAFLASCLKWDDFVFEENLQQSILLDFLYDSLMFPIEKGFSWKEVCLLFTLAKEMQEETIGRPITDAVKLFKTKLQSLVQSVHERSLKIFSEYFFGSFMTHYKLFQYCFTREQDRMMVEYDRPVDAPHIPQPLKTSKPVKIWEYEEQLHDIERHEAERKNERLVAKEMFMLADSDLLEKAGSGYESDPESSTKLDRQHIKEIIKEVTSAHMSTVSHRIKCAIDDTQEDLEFKLEKTSLPRPQALDHGDNSFLSD